ncbi:unnamed protein product [Caenorhabditis sp. 36 PRJEB53466]|nr:unnamed protein product [Caenorhabditis sp. 36 PRJEB53466]
MNDAPVPETLEELSAWQTRLVAHVYRKINETADPTPLDAAELDNLQTNIMMIHFQKEALKFKKAYRETMEDCVEKEEKLRERQEKVGEVKERLQKVTKLMVQMRTVWMKNEKKLEEAEKKMRKMTAEMEKLETNFQRVSRELALSNQKLEAQNGEMCQQAEGDNIDGLEQ